ncbi:MAG: hypothetical protein K9J06_15330 [Flavobacteriales bacterium]|nr:hypothetical protein [Flavobacteriales bacterium]
MNILLEIAMTLAYTGLFLLVIRRWAFFRIGGIPINWFQGVFVAKVLSGILLSLIYTHYYTDRSTADIWKYYDDGLVMFSALSEQPLDYFRMLFGIFNDTPHLDRYYSEMGHWYRPYGSQMANDTHTIIRFNAAMRLISLGFYQVHSVFANFLGLVGLTGIFVFLRQMAPYKERWLFAGVFLMPWVMFWGSGVLKEPLLFLGLGVFLLGMKGWADHGLSLRNVASLVLSLLFLFTVKSYALAALLPGLLAWRLTVRMPRLHPAPVFLAVYLLVAGMAVGAGKLLPDLDILQRLAQKQRDFNMLAIGGTYVRTAEVPNDTLYIPAQFHSHLAFSPDRKRLMANTDIAAKRWSEAYVEDASEFPISAQTPLQLLLDYGTTGSGIAIPYLDGSLLSTVKAVPMALVNALFRPFPNDISSAFMMLAMAENLLLILLILLVCFRLDSQYLGHPVLWLCIFFAAVILILTGLVTPVVGAIVRYKVPALPFLVSALLVLLRPFGMRNKTVMP